MPIMPENNIKEIIFLVEEDDEGGYIAKAINQSIFTQADSLPELRELIKDAVHCHYPDEKDKLHPVHPLILDILIQTK
ncbi:MAG: 2-oxoisovalerate dehydrogenase E1 subunit beta [Sphaerospermopsis kisseleviana]|jgi:hypothetical protein|uniref:2-oxoisovalerate dehydrogenase n=1 Tax=Sphaerospermopsis TaxID=752201 RepID=UPI000B6234CE|nr:2-oxoisovalerate dehydrogenase [Sphaerospermopsis aphanizomenoides]BAZ79250.1 hypothetical protein NIES73_04910 [Sphaerospermopsis kisseleviana NIES-73]